MATREGTPRLGLRGNAMSAGRLSIRRPMPDHIFSRHKDLIRRDALSCDLHFFCQNVTFSNQEIFYYETSLRLDVNLDLYDDYGKPTGKWPIG